MVAGLAVVGTLVALSLILAITEMAERRLVSDPSLIVGVVRASKLSPEYVEAYVTRRAAKLIAESR